MASIAYKTYVDGVYGSLPYLHSAHKRRKMLRRLPHGHAQVSFKAALHTILFLTRKYAAIVSQCRLYPAQKLQRFKLHPRSINGLKIFLERATSVQLLNPPLTALQVLDIVLVPIDALFENPNKTVMREWYTALGDWLHCALASPNFAP